jgi:23S rRNA U2552 (ribose-2'-O)-methylase RlmE/FtsJ
MQCCDLLFSWNNSLAPGSNSGIAMDMMGAHRKVIVKDVPHYHTPANIPNVLKGRINQKDFAQDVINALRNEDLTKVADISKYSWDALIKDVIAYYEEFL